MGFNKSIMHSGKKPQSNSLLEQVHQLVYNMVSTKDIINIVFDYIDPWDDILSSIVWLKINYCLHTLKSTPVQ